MFKKIVLCLLLCISSNACAHHSFSSLWSQIKLTFGALAYAAKNAVFGSSVEKSAQLDPEIRPYDKDKYLIRPTITFDAINRFQEAKEMLGRACFNSYNRTFVFSGSGTDTLLFAQATAAIMQHTKPSIQILQISYEETQRLGIDTVRHMVQTCSPCIIIVDARNCAADQDCERVSALRSLVAHYYSSDSNNTQCMFLLINDPQLTEHCFYWGFMSTLILHFNAATDALPTRLAEYEYTPGMEGSRIGFFRFDK